MSIVLDHVSRSYQGHRVLNQFSFSFPDQGRYALFGPSGCGKTTLLRIIGGLEAPDNGHVIRPPSQRVAWMFQENRLLPWFTVEKNLNFVTGDLALSREWLERIKLPKIGSLYPEQLSGGMKRRVSLARTLALDAEILLIDEPFKELDTASADTMLQLVDEYTQNRLLIIVTHQLSDLEKLQCQRISLSLPQRTAK